MNDIQVNNHSSVVKLVKPADSAPGSEKEPQGLANKDSAEVSGISDVKNIADVKNTKEKTGIEGVEKVDDAEKPEALKEAVTRLTDFVQKTQRDLQFKLDESSGRTVITVLDRSTQEIIRQIPDDEALKLAQSLHQDEPLTLFTAKV